MEMIPTIIRAKIEIFNIITPIQYCGPQLDFRPVEPTRFRELHRKRNMNLLGKDLHPSLLLKRITQVRWMIHYNNVFLHNITFVTFYKVFVLNKFKMHVHLRSHGDSLIDFLMS